MKGSRREFLKRSGGCALGMVSLATQMHHLGLMSALAKNVEGPSKALGGENYKALVLVFFSGGNDGNNAVIPNHSDPTLSNYSVYAAGRGPDLAIPQGSLLPITVPRMGGLTYGLHPNFGTGTTNAGIHPLWADGKLAVVANVGTLVQPTTKAQYTQPTHPKPYQLYSHSDQTFQNQTSISNSQSFTGWGGRISDKLTSPQNPNALIPMITSIAGAKLFTAGQTTLPMAIADSNTSLANVLNPQGFTNNGNGGPARLAAFNALRTVDLDSNFVAAASHVTDLAMQANAALQTPGDTTVTFPNTSIGRQLRQVARLIKKRTEVNVNRQIFYVQIGGFDTHSGQPAQQVNLFNQFSQAARSFYDEMTDQNIQNGVTLFTLSDFGRTFQPSGSGTGVGSDHAWGNHMFVLGGSVLGGDFYGMNTAVNGTPYPHLQPGGLDDTDSGSSPRGRWIPTTSVDQYAATIARWFGLAEVDIPLVFPNIGNFPTSDLGFMPAP
ncbi:MAG: DUF1501 domain-containing protein [Pyrinomonadaceae bacterium]